jgi:hypothetical protein
MATPNAKSTLQSRFGFQDSDLTTPQHDSILLWLLDHAEDVIRYLPDRTVDLTAIHRAWLEEQLRELRYYRKQNTHDDDADKKITACRKQIEDLPAAWIYPVPLTIVQKRSEQPVLNGTFPIGFVDLFIETKGEEPVISTSSSDVDKWEAALDSDPDLPGYCLFKVQEHYYFEIKSRIPSLGEMIRQLRMYEQYIPNPARQYSSSRTNSRLGVVSPDRRFAREIRNEGFFFVPLSPSVFDDWRIEEKEPPRRAAASEIELARG